MRIKLPDGRVLRVEEPKQGIRESIRVYTNPENYLRYLRGEARKWDILLSRFFR
jgi:hypothetical protein